MKNIVVSILPWVGRYWLRISVIAVFLFVINQKQIDLSIQLGSPQLNKENVAPKQEVPEPKMIEGRAEALTENKPEVSASSWLQQMNVFSSPTYVELQQRLQRVPVKRVQGFIRRFSHVAQKEQDKFGIPASIILANALLQSGSGTTEAAKAGDNLFNLTCTPDWKGPEVSADGHCYRKYDNAWTSFRDHSLFLTTGRFAGLRQQAANDYSAWAAGLETLQFNEIPDLEMQILGVIEQWQLFQFDR